MALSAGDRLGPYEVTGELGAGGMGIVLRARDTKLDRDVALKVLPDLFANDAERLGRFQREAKVLASLNHPNIASIYGLEESDGVQALVLELVEGPTLADRIAQGPIPLDEALPIARQIAEALEAAHEQGIIHRDLKPANVKVKPDGSVKVLDFGLAKALDPRSPGGEGRGEGGGFSASPTISLTAAATQMGMVVGTAAYMSPEQASGKAVDRRADVWAFGAVLYEMLTGERAFRAEDVSLTLARVLDREPDWQSLPPTLPTGLSTVLRRCLQKDPRQRLRDVGDARLALDGAFEAVAAGSSERPVATDLHVWQRPVPAVSTALLLAVITGLAVWGLTRRTPPPPSHVTRFPILLPAGDTFGGRGSHVVALSPDGTQLAWVVRGQIYLRPLDQIEATPIRGTEGGPASHGRSPFFSADGQWLGFWAGGQLKRVSVSGGAPVTLCEAEQPSGVSWGADDTILFGQGPAGIWRVPGTGGTPEVLIPVAEGEQAQSPQMLPGGEWVLFTLRPSVAAAWDQSQIVVQSLVTEERRVLIDGGKDGRYVPTGHLVYALEGSLLAVPFDPDQLTITPGPVPLVEGVTDAGGRSGATHFSLSMTGSLVYVPGAGLPGGGGVGEMSTLVWVDRAGGEEPLPEEPRPYGPLNLSPDGTRLAVDVDAAGNRDVWIYDLVRDTFTRLTFDPAGDGSPVWSPDGQRVAFYSTGRGGLFWRAADGTGQAELLQESGQFSPPWSFSPDGTALVTWHPTGGAPDLGLLSLEGERASTALLETEFAEVNAAVSPEGRWLAYSSDESGVAEIYVRPFPDVESGRWQVSGGGGQWPVWGPDGDELFYVGPQGMMAVAVSTEPTFVAGTPDRLFDTTGFTFSGIRTFDIAPDGERFLMLKTGGGQAPGTSAPAPRIIVVENWFEELKARVPAP